MEIANKEYEMNQANEIRERFLADARRHLIGNVASSRPCQRLDCCDTNRSWADHEEASVDSNRR